MLKLAVGIRDIAHLRAVQAARLAQGGPLRTQTRTGPRRAAEVVDGGSIYWVIAGSILVRQRIVDVQPDLWDDGSACVGLHLDPGLVAVSGRPTRPFQGWRYLEAADAPADLVGGEVAGLPDGMRRELRALGLI
jgi:hypothetical protein